MKIYFEDGELRNSIQLPFTNYIVISAANGVSRNICCLDDLIESDPNTIVYTNSIIAFSNEYAWNEKLKVPEIYIRAGEYMIFTRIDKLATRELCQGYNLAEMYISGEFDNHTKG